MGRTRVAALLMIVLTAVSAAVAPASAVTPTYYLSLGDSLAAGYQPGGDTPRGYADDVAASLVTSQPGLRLEKLGCTGETVASMLTMSVCAARYPSRSQLTAATTFLAAHHGQVKYLTIDIGANDVSRCAASGTLDASCAQAALLSVTSGLATILSRLYAADPSVPVSVGLTYYDPYLPASALGQAGFARDSLVLQRALNLVETAVFARYGYRVADVATAFHTGQTTPEQEVTTPALGRQPYDVAFVCRYTHICTDKDIHPTDAGYRIIADSVLAVLPR